MRRSLFLLPLALLSVRALAQPMLNQYPEFTRLAAQVSVEHLRATDTRLVAFGTRHTLSDTQSDTRGIGAARRWIQSRFSDLSKTCGGCLEIQTPSQTFIGARIPQPTQVMDMLAVQRGASDPNRVIVISAHMDSRNGDPLDAKGDAPGANDVPPASARCWKRPAFFRR